MMKLKNLPILALCTFLITSSVHAQKEITEEFKNLVNMHVKGETFKSHIEDIYNYTIENIKNCDINVYKNFLNKEKYTPKLESEDVIQSVLNHLESIKRKENPDRADILMAVKSSAALFSYDFVTDLFSNEKDLDEEDMGYRFFIDCREETPHTRNTFELACQHFTPLILTGERSFFSESEYLYAFSKGCVLYGLDTKKNDAHGGLFKTPIEFFMHSLDFLINDDLFSMRLTAQRIRERESVIDLILWGNF